jgi:ribosomal-protein-alanine N-acetyltransferase
MKQQTRVEIRRPQLNDCAAFLDMVGSSRRFHRPWVYTPDTQEKFARFVEKSRDGRNEGFLVTLKNDGTIAGVINLNEIIRGALQGCFVGFYGAAALAGRGYMTEGLSLVIRHAFHDLKLHRLEANIQPTNKPSIALVKRCGFTPEGFSPRYLKIGGRWRDHERWALTRE